MSRAAIRALVWGLAFSALCGTEGLASPFPDNSHPGSPLPYPARPAHDEQKPPYPMNYTDEAAQTLGVRNGRMDLFSSQPVRGNPLIPTISGGLGGEGATLRLQWHPDE